MTNPYASPESSDASAAQDGRIARQIDKFAVIAWPIVFGLNMIVPAMLGWNMTREQGRMGMFAASGVLLALGWWVCLVKNALARRLIVGSLLTALSQFVPVLQIGAGVAAVALASQLELADIGFANAENVTELGGFVITFVVGGILIACAGIAGLIAGLVLPQRWMVMQ